MRQLVFDEGVIKAFPIVEATYARLSVGTAFPSSPVNNDLLWRSDQNKVYRYIEETAQWYEINWQNYVKSSPDWINGKLRVNSTTGKLEISPDGSNWYECIPAVGAQCIEILTIDNTDFSYKYFILPGQRLIFRNSNHIPIVFTRDVEFNITAHATANADMDNLLLVISNISASTYNAHFYRVDYEVGNSYNVFIGHYLGWLTSAGPRRVYSTMYIYICTDNHIISCGLNKFYYPNSGLGIDSNSSVIASAYWLGVLKSSISGNPIITASYITVTRMT